MANSDQRWDGIEPYALGSPRLIAVARSIPERSG
jgi:hypothetical protein